MIKEFRFESLLRGTSHFVLLGVALVTFTINALFLGLENRPKSIQFTRIMKIILYEGSPFQNLPLVMQEGSFFFKKKIFRH